MSRAIDRTASSWLALGFTLIALAACPGEDPGAQPDATAPRPMPKRPTVVFLTPAGEIPVTVSVARTPAQKEQGLMFVEKLADDHGMLFLMGPPERVLSFWMKNTFIPLDMVFVDATMEIVGIVERAEPLTTSPRRVERPSSYVVEVNGGWAARHGLAPGMKVRFENVY